VEWSLVGCCAPEPTARQIKKTGDEIDFVILKRRVSISSKSPLFRRIPDYDCTRQAHSKAPDVKG
jgi:hypothetical protein